MPTTPEQFYEFILVALCIWREARGETLDVKKAVGWSIRNRFLRPGWWGHSWEGIVLLPWQYSSFNHNDPNATKLPTSADPSWGDSLTAASMVWTADVLSTPFIPDPTSGADSYFDMSLDSNPPSWATDGSKQHTLDIGRLHFYRTL